MPSADKFPGDLLISEFHYELPEAKIARYPLADRDASKLLVFHQGEIRETRFSGIAGFLPSQSLMIFNNSKVIGARLIFNKRTGGQIEIFCLEPADPQTGMHLAMHTKEKLRWKCLIGGASKWKRGTMLEKKTAVLDLQATFIEKKTDYFIIEFSWSPPSINFSEVLNLLGSTPLPPYLKRPAEALDAERYQTIYAREEGSVAAPTAGLHFTPRVFDSLAQWNISCLYITLHVGAGTFLPVKSDRLRDHLMHEEFIEVNLDTVRILLEKLSGYITAVGTTTLRTVESLYWLGVKTTQNKNIAASELSITQWDPYHTDPGISVNESLCSLQEWISRQPDKKLITRTQLFIVPGYQFKIIRGLVTNFHQPQSTLLLLVGALIGKDWKKVYQFALENDYRFLSYGDGCMFLTD